MRDIDSSRGCFAPYSIVDIGSDDYVYIHEQGIFQGDGHAPIGQGKYSKTLIDRSSYDRIEQIQGVLDPRRQIVWWRAQDSNDQYWMFGYDLVPRGIHRD